jgi:hypothetical protein
MEAMGNGKSQDIQQSLSALYEKFRSNTTIPETLGARLSSPLLLSVSDAWLSSNHRILMVGQEVQGWAFERGHYYDWPHQPLRHFNDFKKHSNAVADLIEAYIAFDFSKHQPDNYRSPFWAAYRKLRAELEEDVDASVLWTNLFRMSVDRGSAIRNRTFDQLKLLQEKQLGLLRDEITILRPDAIIFFIGPDYDETLSMEFPGTTFESMGFRPPKILAKLSHPTFPPCSLRTYHPTFLRRQRLWAILDEIIHRVRNTTPPIIGLEDIQSSDLLLTKMGPT